MSESEGHIYRRDHQLQGTAIRLNLSEQAADLLAEARPASQRRAARTLIKEGPLRLTLLALVEGGSIDEHRAGGPVSIEVVNDGAVTIEAAGERYELQGQDALVLDAGVTHSLRASRDTVLLLTIAMAA
jgi:quercetin dioxygenase-like cupin family protein